MNQIFSIGVSGALYLIAQVLIFNHLTLFGVATPFVFLLFLFMLPFSISPAWLYVIAFGYGLLTDAISTTWPSGLHAFSAVLAMSLRPRLAMLAGSASFRAIEEIDPKGQPFSWLAIYLFPLLLIHHGAFFLLDAFSFAALGWVLLKAFLSAVYTFVIGATIYFVIYRR